MDTTRIVVYTLLALGAASTVVYLRRVARSRPEEVPAMFRPSTTPVAPAATRAKDDSRVPAIDRAPTARLESATFAFGWFWGPDSRFGSIPGVIRTRVGYTGGSTPAPTYHDLADHTETLQVDFDPAVVSYADLLAIFWEEHHPDARSYSVQYKAAVFVHGAAQRALAESTRAAWSARNGREARTEVLDAGPFHVAEDYHQKWQLRRDDALAAEVLSIYDEAGLRDSTAAARINGYLGGNGDVAQLRAELPALGLSSSAGAALLARVEAMERQGATPGCR